MAVTLKQTEAEPTEVHPIPANLSPAALEVDALAIWQRIEAYTARRWTARQVVWIIEGGEVWEPPLSPASNWTFERWDGSARAWTACETIEAPTGFQIAHGNTYRATATVGGGDLPAAVEEAYRRLAEYVADTSDRSGVSRYSVNMGGAIQESYDRNPAWMARALELSGAADLLRPYRRA